MKTTLEERESKLAYLFIIPTFAIVLGIIIFPVLYNIWLSFHDVTLGNLGENPPFNGIKNYEKVVSEEEFLQALLVTIIYSIFGVVLSLILGLAAALLLNRTFKGRGLVRGIFLFTYIAPIVALAFIWRWMLNPVYGVVQYGMLQIGIIKEPVAWLSVKPLALICVILFEGWRYFPFDMLFILARLQAISEDLYEAAEVDGANTLQKFWHITLPELKYVLGTLFLLRFMWTFNKFDDIFLLTSGAAGTKVLPILVYDYAFPLSKIGLGAATSMFLFIILITFMVIYVRKVLQW